MKKLLLPLIGILFSVSNALGQTLIHYWNFNNSTSESTLLAPSSLVSGSSLIHQQGTNSGGFTSAIPLTGNTTGQGFETTNPNARNGDAADAHLRFNNPTGGKLIFSIPTTGYKNIVVKYATRRSGSGAYNQVIDYSTDGINYINYATILPVDGNPTLQTIDLSGIASAAENANLKIRISFTQGAGGLEGNNRFDNFTVDGDPASGDNSAPVISFSPLNNATNLAATTAPSLSFNEDVRLANNTALTNTNVDDLVELRLNDAAGSLIPFDASVSGRVITITPSTPLQNNQKYYVALKAGVLEDLSDNLISTVQSAVFTTIAAQTQFQAGDIIPVAYRMNATSAEDEVAFLTLVNILPGTLINFTDGKYTTNVPAQCSGGLVWTAPETGVAAGTVIKIQTSALVTSHGTLSGTGFGLSSSGDQVLVYTGSNDNPNYITALSANNWLQTNTSCSGSSSMLPAGLSDGTSSLNMSTAAGNASGITVNAYYNGTQQGTNAQLKAAILNPANWVSSPAASAAQVWPNYTFPGPPVVQSAKVINQSTVELTFNNDLDNSSATNLVNFSGIAGLSSVSRSDNGSHADVLTLTFSTPFSIDQTYTLSVNGIKDSENRSMVNAYAFSFTYSPKISFKDKFISVDEGAGSATITLLLENPSAGSATLALKAAPFSNTDNADITFANTTIDITGNSPLTQTITIPVNDDSLSEMDEYFVLSLENLSGVALSGKQYLTVYIKDNDRKAPVASQEIKLNYVTSFKPNTETGSTTEIVAYDAASQRLFMTSATQDRLDIADFSNPGAITLVKSIDMKPYGGVTSVAVKNGILAVASPANPEDLDGSVVIFNTSGDFQKQVTVGALPDMITFSPDGTKILTANEGQPNADYSLDPEGSVSIIDISGGIASLDQSKVSTLLFTGFNAQEASLIAAGVRKAKLTSTLSQDLEPEYITVSSDSKKAWVTLQENNAVAEINLETKTIAGIRGLGKKDFNVAGTGFDASDNSGKIHISNYPVKSFYMPDGIANFTANGKTYLVTANEGDEKEYGSFVERTTVSAVNLDPATFPNAAVLKEDHNIGRLRITNLNGDTDGDGDYDELMMVGARSFSIWDAATQAQVYDSKDDFELITSQHPVFSAQFNADSEGNGLKNRSRSKGPEPEGVTVATIEGKTYAFVGLERIGGIMVYNITDPANPKFVDYRNNRSVTSYSGDFGPEGIVYVAQNQSPDGKPYVLIANEISGTISVFSIESSTLPVELLSFDARVQSNAEVKLVWATASETNNDYFLLEKSNDGKSFSPLYKAAAAGDSRKTLQYSFTDKYPSAGINYYRLTQTDKDGAISKPWLVSANLDQLTKEAVMSVYPNPVVGNVIRIQTSDVSLTKASIKLTDLNGRQIYAGVHDASAGALEIRLQDKLNAGTYILQVGSIGSRKIIVRE